jgi:hypothetical protein
VASKFRETFCFDDYQSLLSAFSAPVIDRGSDDVALQKVRPAKTRGLYQTEAL